LLGDRILDVDVGHLVLYELDLLHVVVEERHLSQDGLAHPDVGDEHPPVVVARDGLLRELVRVDGLDDVLERLQIEVACVVSYQVGHRGLEPCSPRRLRISHETVEGALLVGEHVESAQIAAHDESLDLAGVDDPVAVHEVVNQEA